MKRRYLTERGERKRIEVWTPSWHLQNCAAHSILRIQGGEPFRLRWSNDNWLTQTDTELTAGALAIDSGPAARGFVESRWQNLPHFLLAEKQPLGR